MKVQSVPKDVRVHIADLVEQIDVWKALKQYAILRQDELSKVIASDTACTLEELRINQGKLLEVKAFIDKLAEIHKLETTSK